MTATADRAVIEALERLKDEPKVKRRGRAPIVAQILEPYEAQILAAARENSAKVIAETLAKVGVKASADAVRDFIRSKTGGTPKSRKRRSTPGEKAGLGRPGSGALKSPPKAPLNSASALSPSPEPQPPAAPAPIPPVAGTPTAGNAGVVRRFNRG